MKRLKSVISSIIFLFFISITPSVHAANISTPSAEFVDDEIIVTVKATTPKTNVSPIAQTIQGEIQKELLLKNTFLLKIPKGNVEKVMRTLSDISQVATASPNYKVQKMMTTNDVAMDKEWGLFKTQVASSSAKSAWDITTGKPGIKVAILDTGIEKTHTDLEEKVVVEKNFSSSPTMNDINGHGTQMAGIIAAIGNNAKGIAGVSYGATLMNVKVLDDEGTGNYSDIIDGIVWATDNGAKVINMSFGGEVPTEILEEAVNYAYSKGVILVGAAGNSGTNSVLYPAGYNNVLSVTAINEEDEPLSWSNYGTLIKIAAPGASIYSTFKGDTYSYASGTSMATAFTSGVAALIWSTDLCETNICVMERIEKTTDEIPHTGMDWEYGRINAYQALTEQISSTSAAIITPSISPTATPAPTEEPVVPPIPNPKKNGETKIPTPTKITDKLTVSHIEVSYKKLDSTDIFAKIMVTKLSDNTKVSGASVTLDVTTPKGKVYTGTSQTKANGQVTFALRETKELGIYKIKVVSVSKKGYIYSPTNTTYSLNIKEVFPE